jgi:hypothetical protein
MSSEDEINTLVKNKIEKIKDYLNSQSMSELEKINSNVSKFIEEQFIEEQNKIDLLNNEINKQTKINNTKANLLNFEKKVKELEKQKNELAEKAINKSKFMNEIKTQIEERFNLPKNKLVSDLINQSITYPEFMQKFKHYSMKYNFYNYLLLELDKNT